MQLLQRVLRIGSLRIGPILSGPYLFLFPIKYCLKEERPQTAAADDVDVDVDDVDVDVDDVVEIHEEPTPKMSRMREAPSEEL